MCIAAVTSVKHPSSNLLDVTRAEDTVVQASLLGFDTRPTSVAEIAHEEHAGIMAVTQG